MLYLRIVYDNDALQGFRRGWGFACLVGDDLLFDTGANLGVLLYNMNKFEIDLGEIKRIVFSHEHGDHIGGYEIIENLGNVEVYVPKSFSKHFKKRISSLPNVVLKEVTKIEEITDKIYTTGELGFFIKEQSLIIETENGVTLLTGCSHPGLDKIIRLSSAKINKVSSVIGGFHGFSRLEMLKDLDLIVPCHCTIRKKEILRLYSSKSRKCYAGLQLEI